MLNSGFWLNKNGILFDVTNSTHIDFIIKNPELFGLTFEEIKKVYEKYGEENELNRQKASEGKQREEIIKNVYSQGWIRIRFYNRRGWVLQTDSIKERQGLIKSFLMQQSGDGIKLVKYGNETNKKIMSPYDMIYIQDLEGNLKQGEVTKMYKTIYESIKMLNYIFYLFENINDLKEQILYEQVGNLKNIFDKSNEVIIEQIQLRKKL